MPLLLLISKALNDVSLTENFIIRCMDLAVTEQPVIKIHLCLSSRVSCTVSCVCVCNSSTEVILYSQETFNQREM